MTYFLVEHDRRLRHSRVTPFEDRDASIRALNSTEAARDHDTDVVLLIAESEANIRITHPRYFWDDISGAVSQEANDTFARYLADLQELIEERDS